MRLLEVSWDGMLCTIQVFLDVFQASPSLQWCDQSKVLCCFVYNCTRYRCLLNKSWLPLWTHSSVWLCFFLPLYVVNLCMNLVDETLMRINYICSCFWHESPVIAIMWYYFFNFLILPLIFFPHTIFIYSSAPPQGGYAFLINIFPGTDSLVTQQRRYVKGITLSVDTQTCAYTYTCVYNCMK